MRLQCRRESSVATKWLTRARERGAIIVSVDPRYTRTSSFSDVYCKMRSGTDIAFVGGMINYALQNDFIQKEYVRNYTNASFIVNEQFSFHDGLFSGYDLATRSYDNATWAYVLDETGNPARDMTLQDPRCVYQVMKKHFSRYDIDTVCRITGSPEDLYQKICERYTSTCMPDRVGTWLYAMGTTQHTHGTQNIRTYAILQLLLGNVGLAGGGVNALRGESNVQGSTDMCLLFHILPGYLKSPTQHDQTLEQYIKNYTPTTTDPNSANWWGNTPKYIVSLLKAWYGEHANRENEFGYQYIPKRSENCSFISLFEAIHAERIKGLILFGQNPAVAGPNVQKGWTSMGKLDWMVAVDLFETETANFWNRPGVDSKNINTEVFLLPACSSVEKEGSITNSGRWAQWRYKAVEPPGESRSDLWILDNLCKSLKNAYRQGGVFPDPIVNLDWNYGTGNEINLHMEPDVHRVAREINGYFTEDKTVKDKNFTKGDQVPSFAFLQDDGSTSAGNWLYCNAYPGPDKKDNKMARRGKTDAANGIGLYPEWAWCWPVNRRILYNRASVDLEGRPWSSKRWVIRWNSDTKQWEGDVPDGGWPPGTKHPFIMKPDGHGQLFAPTLADGPLPEHYEPVESPVANLMSGQAFNPAVKLWHEVVPEGNPIGDALRFPIVGTTYRVSEHWQAGAMTRNLPWLAELVPDVFVELSNDLAAQKKINNGDRVVVETARGKMEAYALLSNRFEPFYIHEKAVHQIGIIWHFGYSGLAKGYSANILTANIGDANTMIPEYKAFLCDINKKTGGEA